MAEKLTKNMSVGVIIYTLAYMLGILIYCGPRILAEIGFDVSHMATNLDFPIDIYSWGLFLICTGYAGIDMGFGKKLNFIPKTGDVEKKRVQLVIGLLLAVLAECILFNIFLGRDYIVVDEFGKTTFKGINLPLEGISTALVGSSFFYICGNPAPEIVKSEKTD